jgi:hypothetical protein
MNSRWRIGSAPQEERDIDDIKVTVMVAPLGHISNTMFLWLVASLIHLGFALAHALP